MAQEMLDKLIVDVYGGQDGRLTNLGADEIGPTAEIVSFVRGTATPARKR